MREPATLLPEWGAPVAEPVVTLIPMESLAKEILDRDILDLKGTGFFMLLLIVLTMWRRTVRRPSGRS